MKTTVIIPIVVTLCLLCALPITAQHTITRTSDFTRIDKLVGQTPEEAEASLQALAHHLARASGPNELYRTRAIFRWIADNISYDTELFKAITGKLTTDKGPSANTKKEEPETTPAKRNRPKVRNRTAEEVLEKRSAVCGGYANIFQRLAELMGLKTEYVTGYSKAFGYTPGEDVTRNRHAWNMVRINNRWYLLDPTWGSGYIDDEGKFVRRLNEYYFLTPPKELILTHFPEDSKYQMMSRPVTLKQFKEFVYMHPRFFRLGLGLNSHKKGLIRAQSDVTVKINCDSRVALVAGLMRDNNKLPKSYVFTQNVGSCVQVNAVFPEAGQYKLRVFAKKREDEGNTYQYVMDYDVKATSGKSGKMGFPETYKVFHEKRAQLYSPMNFYLRAGKKETFKIRVPGASKVAVFMNKNESKSLGRAGSTFSGSVMIPEGDVTICAQFPRQKDYTGIVRYQGR